MTKVSRNFLPLLFAVGLVLTAVRTASAHQPFFEDDDFTATAPGTVADPTVSTALYATLSSSQDVDYVSFEGTRGQSILVGITIPRIEGQEFFTPTVAVMGPGLPAAPLPRRVVQPPETGAAVIPAPPGPARIFDEPFSGTSYWDRQETRLTLPASGRYTLAVWDDEGRAGRYTLVVGDREIMGGDPAFPFKLRAYWTPVVVEAESPARQCGR